MHEFLYIVTDDGILGYLPSGTAEHFDNIAQYREKYQEEENEIIDCLAELQGPVEYPEDWWMVQC